MRCINQSELTVIEDIKISTPEDEDLFNDKTINEEIKEEYQHNKTDIPSHKESQDQALPIE